MSTLPVDRRRPAFVVGGMIVATLLALSLLVMRSHGGATITMSAPLVQLDPAALTEAEQRDRDITFYTARVAGDAHGATDRLTLATLLLSRARVRASVTDLAAAESLASASFRLRPERNAHALEVLASAMMARHEFGEARLVAARADSLEPANASHLALLGEIDLELGDYAAAAREFSQVHLLRDQFTIAARVARWYELTGHVDRARSLLRGAILDVGRRTDLPREQVAWFHFRLGELELRTGRLAAADSAFTLGLSQAPEDIRLLGGLARVSLAKGDARRAAELAARATAIQLDPATLATAYDAFTAIGDTLQAAQYSQALSVVALEQPGPLHRAWAMHLLDHGTDRQRREVLRRIRAVRRERQDVYTYDLLAWALYRTGDARGAAEAMSHALAQQTEDVSLAAHARVIREAARSRRYEIQSRTPSPRSRAPRYNRRSGA